MTASQMPLWLDLLVSALALCGAGIALIGSWGLFSMPTFFSRMHTPAIIATLGCWYIMHAALVYFSALSGTPALRVLLIALFVAVTVPITSIFLMRAALFRARRAGEQVPANLSGGPSQTDAPDDTVDAAGKHETRGTAL